MRFAVVARRRWLAALVVGYGLLAVAWTMVQPPFRSPDEIHHYVRVLGVSEGEIVGRKAPYRDPRATATQLRWVRQNARAVEVAAALSPRTGECPSSGRAERCQTTAVTPVGTYQPMPYLLPAILVKAAEGPVAGDRLARIGALLAWLACIALAACLLWDSARGALSLLGLLVAVTPMAIFLGATLNPSGIEIAASIAFSAALLRLVRDGEARARILVPTALTGALLALSRSTGPLWVGVDFALVLLLAGGRHARAVVQSAPVQAGASALVVALAAVVNRVWEAAHGPKPKLGLSPLGDSLAEIHRQARGAIESAIGWFGSLEVKPPSIAYFLWAALVLGLLLLAVRVGTRRERLSLLLATGAGIAIPALLVAGFMRHTGFPLQGRHVLPLCAVVPLIAGEVVLRHGAILSRVSRRLVAAAFPVAALVQATCFYAAARFAAVGRDGPWWFLGDAHWSPPAGWPLWLGTVALGSLAVAAAAVGVRAPVPRPR